MKVSLIRSNAIPTQMSVDVLDFRGEGDRWSDFILAHRYKSSLNDCNCYPISGFNHPKIVCGPNCN
jgi:hypothetical protein